MTKRCLDLFCGAGGAGMGYHLEGFEVVGVDIAPQPHYPFEFHQSDAFEYLDKHWMEFDLIHASPPCQKYSAMQHIHNNRERHPDLVDSTRLLLQKTGKLFVIENVIGSPLRTYIMLCGTMFNLPIIRHRLFETNFPLPILSTPCNHDNVFDPFHGGKGARINETKRLAQALEISWTLDQHEVREAIPPKYTQYIGHYAVQAMDLIQKS